MKVPWESELFHLMLHPKPLGDAQYILRESESLVWRRKTLETSLHGWMKRVIIVWFLQILVSNVLLPLAPSMQLEMCGTGNHIDAYGSVTLEKAQGQRKSKSRKDADTTAGEDSTTQAATRMRHIGHKKEVSLRWVQCWDLVLDAVTHLGCQQH